jgi:hypothetical protein
MGASRNEALSGGGKMLAGYAGKEARRAVAGLGRGTDNWSAEQAASGAAGL